MIDLTTRLLLQKYSPQDPRLQVAALVETSSQDQDASTKASPTPSISFDPRLSWLLDNNYPLDAALLLYQEIKWPQPAIN